MVDRVPEVRLTPAATQALAQRDRRLLVELELLFSCLVRKRVKFPDSTAKGYPLTSTQPMLELHFHPIVSHHCKLEEVGVEQPKDDLPLAKPDAFMPRWVSLDYRHGEWTGDFGYADP